MRIHNARKVRSIWVNIQGENFARLAFYGHVHGPTAHFTVGREVLRRHAGIDDQVERLAAERTLHCFRRLHGKRLYVSHLNASGLARPLSIYPVGDDVRVSLTSSPTIHDSTFPWKSEEGGARSNPAMSEN